MFEFYERVSGARMHAAYIRPGGVHQVSGLASTCLFPLCPLEGSVGLWNGTNSVSLGKGTVTRIATWFLGLTSWAYG